jgi:putative ABC transport system substrate-binding protein
MRELGYVDGRDFDFVYRHPDGRADRLTEVAAEVVQLSPQVIIAPATTMAVPVRKVTTTIPIVVPALGGAVELGLIASDARPGGNVTGINPYLKGLPAKQLELAREAVPSARLVGLLHDAGDPKAAPQRLEIEAAAVTAGVKIVTVEARTPADIGPAVEALAAADVQVAIVEQSTMLLVERKQIVDLVAARRVPTVYGYREQADAGGLISYGVNLNWCFHRAAYYVDKILKGATPAELPVEFPTRLQLVINIKTAKALGIEIAPTLLVRADEVIE